MGEDTITITLSDTGYDYCSSMDYNISVANICLTGSTIDLTGYHAQPQALPSISIDDSIFSVDWIEEQRIVEEYKEEKEIRERNAGVQEAWEQYKIMVTLAKLPPDFEEEK